MFSICPTVFFCFFFVALENFRFNDCKTLFAWRSWLVVGCGADRSASVDHGLCGPVWSWLRTLWKWFDSKLCQFKHFFKRCIRKLRWPKVTETDRIKHSSSYWCVSDDLWPPFLSFRSSAEFFVFVLSCTAFCVVSGLSAFKCSGHTIPIWLDAARTNTFDPAQPDVCVCVCLNQSHNPIKRKRKTTRRHEPRWKDKARKNVLKK